MVSIDFVVVDNAKIQVWFYASYDCSIDGTSGCSARGVTDRVGDLLAHAIVWYGDE